MTGINKRSNQPNPKLQKKVQFDPRYGQFGIIKKVADAFNNLGKDKKKKRK